MELRELIRRSGAMVLGRVPWRKAFHVALFSPWWRSSQKASLRRTMWDGTLSGVEFHSESLAFLSLWNEVDTNSYHWRWQPWVDSTAGGYLTLEDVAMPIGTSDFEELLTLESGGHLRDFAEPPALDSNCTDEFSDAAALVSDPLSTNQHAFFTYHVIYSESYKVPTLFFQGFYADGGLLNVEGVRRILSADSLHLLEKSPWTFLTQEEHPVLHRPWLSFHPCGTSNMMSLILSDWLRSVKELNKKQNCESLLSLPGSPKSPDTGTENLVQLQPISFSGKYLVTWLSIVGQFVRLDLPLNLLKADSNGTNYAG